ncbi:MAG: bifunctional adenosylcobinamide kinase/adenosylcobinamide-phosphate guanylyltransferase [Bacteroidales bacterium]
MRKITLITGGQRSGKSRYAMELAKKQTARPVYIATSRIWDDEHRQRIEKHKIEREKGWDNREQEKFLSLENIVGKTVVIDCVTLWCTNFFFDSEANITQSLKAIKDEFEAFTIQDAHFIFVTNEIGLGAISENLLQRKFTDLQGWINQYIAQKADEVILMVSGIPIEIKRSHL